MHEKKKILLLLRYSGKVIMSNFIYLLRKSRF